MKMKKTVTWAGLLLSVMLSATVSAGWSSSDKKTPEQTLDIVDHQGEFLRAYLWLPEDYDPELQYPAVVLAHGCGGAHYKDEPEKWLAKYISGKYKVWGKLLNNEGMMVLLVDSFTTRDVDGDVGGGVCGQSYDSRPAKIDPVSARPADIAAGIHYLKQRSDVQSNKIGVLGYSNGGTSVLALANHAWLDAESDALADQGKEWFNVPFAEVYQANTIISLYPGCGMNGYLDASKDIFDDVFQTYTTTLIYSASDDGSLPDDTLEKCDTLQSLDTGFGDMNHITVPDTDHQFDYYENDEVEVMGTINRIIDLFKAM